MAWTEIYVDPSIAGDSGAGTVGDAYGDLEYAIEQETFDTTNGTRVNIKAGTDEILAAALETALADTATSVAWVPAKAAPLIFQGYTSAAGDGGIGGISGGGSVGVLDSGAKDYIYFIDMHIHNCGSAQVVNLDAGCGVIRCEVNNTTNDGIVLAANGIVSECYVHNCDDTGITMNGGICSHNYIEHSSAAFESGIKMNAQGGLVYRNIITIATPAAGTGILSGTGANVIQNSIFAVTGTGAGIEQTTTLEGSSICNNVVEGFSGTGGNGFKMDSSTVQIKQYLGNAVYNCTTAYVAPSLYAVDESDNETLVASPFTDAANGDFSPVVTGNIKEGSLPADFGNGQ